MTSSQQRALASSRCEIVFDNLTRQLYATDASPYQIEPAAVAFPRSAEEARDAILAADAIGIPVSPRGAGTGLSGGALGDGLIVDFSRHNRQITALDLERRTVRVGAGVVLDQLNAFLKPHGFCFGPDVGTSSRATLGGMIANIPPARTSRYTGPPPIMCARSRLFWRTDALRRSDRTIP
ncbi:MAG: FAD-binding oxidoreductase, partial [Chthoniobacterales bacterium]|nr:FAD-binding oxidoreductase [Chthoniobacterales bacterium]